MSTGPGLSVSQDIIKADGREVVIVEAKEGEEAELTIVLPDEAKYDISASFFHHSSNC